MKKLGKLNLNQLSKVDLKQRKMNVLLGGNVKCCACACRYADTGGGASTIDNGLANEDGGFESPGGGFNFGAF